MNGVIDLLSIDIDGNELYLLNKLSQIRPRVIVVEYNSKFPPPFKKSIKYSPNFIWKYDDYLGSSLQQLVDNLKKKNYALVGCNVSGVNAFFVKKKFSNFFKILSPLKSWRSVHRFETKDQVKKITNNLKNLKFIEL